MSIESAVAHAIHNDFDVVVACPEIAGFSVEELEEKIFDIIVKLQEDLCSSIHTFPTRELFTMSAEALANAIGDAVNLPTLMLVKICRTFLLMLQMDAAYILDFYTSDEEEVSLYSVKMNINLYEENIQLQETIGNRKGGGIIGAAISKMSVWDSISL